MSEYVSREMSHISDYSCMIRLLLIGILMLISVLTGKLDQILSLGGWGCYPEGSGIRILTLDGGGSRGLVALELMSALEQTTGRRLKDSFDLVYGTSTGALILFLHFICEVQLPDCIKLYQKFR